MPHLFQPFSLQEWKCAWKKNFISCHKIVNNISQGKLGLIPPPQFILNCIRQKKLSWLQAQGKICDILAYKDVLPLPNIGTFLPKNSICFFRIFNFIQLHHCKKHPDSFPTEEIFISQKGNCKPLLVTVKGSGYCISPWGKCGCFPERPVFYLYVNFVHLFFVI